MVSITSPESPSTRSVFKDTFTRRRPSMTDLKIAPPSTERSHPFYFDVSQGLPPGGELPATFLSTKDPSSPDYFDVTYRIIADWTPSDPNEVPSQ